MVDERLFEVATALKEWARGKPDIQRVWIYGSRLRGTQRPDSDLDLSIEIGPFETDSDMQLRWMDEVKGWRAQLQSISPYKVHVEMYGTEFTRQYIACCSMLVYERPS
jgi:uncharacterized protein